MPGDYKIETNYDGTDGDMDAKQLFGDSDAQCKQFCSEDSMCEGRVIPLYPRKGFSDGSAGFVTGLQDLR